MVIILFVIYLVLAIQADILLPCDFIYHNIMLPVGRPLTSGHKTQISMGRIVHHHQHVDERTRT